MVVSEVVPEVVPEHPIPRSRFRLGRAAGLLGLVLLALSGCFRLTPEPGLEMEALVFTVTRSGSSYSAASGALVFSGTLKYAVERAVAELMATGGGTIRFLADTYDLGGDWFEFYDIRNILFKGAGSDATFLQNNSSASTDTEIFDCTRCDHITIEDMSFAAGGPVRSTSDALDFDGGDDILIQRVKITASRGRGIVFDGKGSASTGLDTADRNIVRNCVISGVPASGIELLAARDNLIEACTITDVGGNGIVVNKASSSASQPHKQANGNIIISNVIDNSGYDGIRINSSNANVIRGNTVTNSANVVSGRDGIRIFSADGVVCDDNVVELNTATDTQATKTQRYGLKINSSLCHRTVVRSNDFSGNQTGSIYDVGTGTIYDDSPADTEPPSAPTDLSAVVVSAYRADLSWTAATDNVGVTANELFRDGVFLISVGNVTAYSDATTEPGMSYSYQVRARDAAGQVSALSDPAVAQTPSVTTLTFSASRDTYIRADKPDRNHGGATSVQVDGSPVSHGLITFDVSGVGSSSIVGAKLRLHNTNSSSVGGSFYLVLDPNWSEMQVTWNTAPVTSATAFANLGAVSPGNWYEVDATAQVTGDGLVSFRITSSNANGADYATKEYSSSLSPKLILILSSP